MRASSIKTAWPSNAKAWGRPGLWRFLCVALLVTPDLSAAQATSRSRKAQPTSATIQSYQLMIRNQYGLSLREPLTEVTTHRVWLDGEQRIKGKANYWGALISGRLRAEGISPEGENGSELSLRETYLQLAAKNVQLRLGYQSVVWGEAFGFFYGDIINPKDLRESVLSGLVDLADLRTPLPLANLQWFGERSSLQAIYVVGPAMHQYPSLNSSFSPQIAPAGGTTLRAGETNYITRPDGDYGARLGQNFGNLDISLFWFQHRDRQPHFLPRLVSVAPAIVALDLEQSPVTSSGGTATWQAAEHLFRVEAVHTSGRKFNRTQSNNFAPVEADNLVAVVGWDLPSQNRWQLGVQASLDQVASRDELAGRKASEGLFSLRLARESESGRSLELIHAVSLSDGSSLSSLKMSFPRSSVLEFLIGVESLQGTSQSQFGQFKDAGRVLFGLKGVFSG